MVGTLIVAAYAGTTAAGVAASFALTAAAFAVNFAISQIVTRMFMDNPESQQDMGVREQVPPSNVNAIPIVYGEAYMGGTFVDAVLANEQRKMYYVLAISSISPNGQFTFDQTDMYYGDQLITFSGVEPGKVVSLTDQAGNEDTKISGNLFVYLFTSNQAGTITAINSSGSLPSTIMGGADIEVAQRWPASGRQMNGLAFAIVVLNYNRDANTTNLQPITFHVSHTLNGTGVAKPGDVWYDYITNPVYGGAVDAAFVDSTSGTALNAYSDATIPYTPSGGGSATQARYRINGVLDAGQTVLSNLDRIMSSCDSWMTYNAALGKWSVVINKAESTAYAFTDNNIVGDIRVSASDITASINQVEARFPFKENRDQANFVFLALQELNPSLLYPNEPVNKYSITYDLVNDSVQATYLANRLLEQAREDLNVIFNTTYYGIQVDAGNVVSVTNSDYGWDAKLFRVMKVMESSLPDGSLGARIELSEYNAAVYDNQDITQFSPVPNSGLPSVSYFSPLSTPTVTGNPTASVPNFSVTVLIPTTGRITYGNLFYTTTPGTSTSWKLLATAESANSVPVVNGTSYTFLNQVLSAGTYYFAYVVGNDVSQSVLSPASTAFVWSPSGGTTGPTGPTGTAGLRTAILELYKWSATQPTTNFPAGTSVYTWATGQFTMPATPNSWTYTPGSATLGTTLWITRVIYTTSVAEATSTVTWNSTSAYAVGAAGENGTRTGVMEVYQWATEVPTLFPYGQFVYTWATGTFTGSFLRGWSLTPDNPIPGATLYGVTQTIVNQNTTATDTVFWMNQTPYPIGSAGVTGPTGASGSGLNSATVYLYNKNTSTTAPALFSGTFTYTFATAVLSGGTLNGWAQTPPSIAAGEFLFLALATATSATATDTIASTEFSTAQVISGTGTSGANGAQTAIVTIFNKNTSATVAPTSPSGTFTYTFATALLSGGTLNGWAQTAPSILAGEFLWQRQATAYSITATDTIASTEFSGAVVTALAGPTGPSGGGPTGPTGATGTPSTVAGPRNAQIYFFYNTGQSTAPTAPTTAQVSYDFATQTASITTIGWSTTFNPSAVSTTSANNEYWAVLVAFQETVFDGAYTETISSVFTWQNLDGLVTFTNLANSVGSGGTTTTFIDGGSITADTLSVNKVKNNTSGVFNSYVTFGLGTGTKVGAYSAGGAFTSSSLDYYGLLAANTSTGFGIGAGTRNILNADIGAVAAVGYGNATFSTFKNAGYIGTGVSGGTFMTGGAGNLQTVVTADIRLAYYTGGTSYASYTVSGATYPFTAGHDGLQLLTESIPEIGDLMVDSALISAPTVNDCITQMTVTTSANQKGVVGVFTGVCGNDFVPSSLGYYIDSAQGTKTDFVMKPEYADIYDTYRPIGVNAVGEGKINVCGQGGNIAIGDFIVASDMAGKGMKQVDDVFYSHTIAKSREVVTFSSTTEVKQIACIYMGG